MAFTLVFGSHLYKDNIEWKKQLDWGILEANSGLPKPVPIINKLDYE